MAIDYDTWTSGTWSNPAIWTPQAVPGSSDNAYIYSTNTGGPAYVALGGNQSVNNLYVGVYGGTLDLCGHDLTVNSGLNIQGSGTIVENGGSFSTPYLEIDSGNSFALGAGDTVGTLAVNEGSRVTTTASGNVTDEVDVDRSAMTLGAR